MCDRQVDSLSPAVFKAASVKGSYCLLYIVPLSVLSLSVLLFRFARDRDGKGQGKFIVM